MNRIEFFNDCGEVKMELQEVTKVDEEGAKARFKIKDKPVYLCLRFLRPVDEEELWLVYGVLQVTGITEIPSGKIGDEIHDDLENQNMTGMPIGTYELKTTFEKAFACAQSLGYSMPFTEGAFTMAINDEPSENMAKWFNHKRESKIRRIWHDLANIIREHSVVDVGPGVELQWDASREELNEAVKRMHGHGYHLTYQQQKPGGAHNIRILYKEGVRPIPEEVAKIKGLYLQRESREEPASE